MASPQESITTVSGRRCTRSRARTAATSILTTTTTQAPPAVTTTAITTSTTAVEPPTVQTSAAEPPPLSPSSVPPAEAVAPPPSSVAADPPAVAPTVAPTTTQATVSTAIGTLSSVPTPKVPTTAPASPAPSQATVAGPKKPLEISRPVPAAAVPVTQAVEATTTTLATLATIAALATLDPAPAPESTSPNTISTAPLPSTSDPSSLPPPVIPIAGAAESAVLQSSLAASPGSPSQIDTPTQPTPIDTPGAGQPQPQPTAAPVSSLPSGDAAAGIIGPEPGNSDSDGGLTLPSNGDANIGSIVGGVVGGVAGLTLICALLFFCLRKRKAQQPRWSEKNVEGPRLLEKVKAIPASVAVMLAKVKGVKKGPTKNPYQRHSQQDSISSVYSTTESQGFYAPGDFMVRPSSRKSERNRLQKKNSVSSQLIPPGLLADADRNPFADPEPPRILRLSNPDASPRGPLTPQPAITSARPNDPFASPFDNPDPMLPLQTHKRTQSQASGLSSHPPSFMFPSGPPAPSQPPQPSHNRRSSMALPTFDATSTAASGETDYALYGEPGPSRPTTSMFTPGLPTGRTVRQSDPFDLDRPEVLRFGNIMGRTEVRSSLTRQSTRGKRTSSVGNWASMKEGNGPFSSWNSAPRR